MAHDWPLVGRQVELDLVAELLASQSVSGVVLGGDAGVGKTRLATECAALAERAGFVALRVTGTRSAAAIPFGAIAPLLPPIDELGGDPAVVLRRAAEELVSRGAGRPVFLVVDDAQLLDDASMTLVHQVVASKRAFVVATVRVDGLVPESVVSLWKDELAARVELGPLDERDVRALVGRGLGGPVDEATLDRLWAASGGNALFLRELVQGAIESGELAQQEGCWRLTGTLSPSGRLTELIEIRLETLTPACRRALELIAVAEPIELPMLEGLTPPDDIEALGDRQLIRITVEDGTHAVRISHPLYAEVLRARMPVVAAQAHRRALADAFEDRGVTPGDVLRVALWRLDGGGPCRAAVMAEAARQARSRFDFELAERLARAAHRSGAGFNNLLLLATVLGATSRGEEADRLLADGEESAATDRERTMLALVRMDNLAYGLDRYQDAVTAAEESASRVQGLAWRAELNAKRALVLVNLGRLPEALAIVEPLLAGEGRALVWATLAAAYAYGTTGRLAEALAACDAGAEARRALPPEETEHLWHLVSHTLARVLALSFVGELAEAAVAAAREHERALADGSTEIQAWFAWSLARTSAARGDVEAADRWAYEALGRFRQQRNPQPERLALAEIALASAASGRIADADAAVVELDTMPGQPVGWLRSEFSRARAWRAAADGDAAAARRRLEEAATVARGNGETVPELLALLDLVRLDAAGAALDRLAEVAPTIEGPLAPAALAFARAAVADDGPSLEQVGYAFEAFGALLVAAEALNVAALAFRRRGQARRAAPVEARAAGLAARCPGARTPGLASPIARHLLSPREYEIACLVARGLGHRDIAERLGTSTRTVDNQLQRAYSKLGVSSRAALAHALETLASPTPE